MNVHMKTHSREETYKCKECGVEFRCKETLVEHMRKHIESCPEDYPYICMGCGAMFAVRSKLTQHLTTHGVLDENIYSGGTCGVKSSKKKPLALHMQGQNDTVLNLNRDKVATSEPTQQNEVAAVLSKPLTVRVPEITKYTCPECKQMFVQPNKLVMHMLTHLQTEADPQLSVHSRSPSDEVNSEESPKQSWSDQKITNQDVIEDITQDNEEADRQGYQNAPHARHNRKRKATSLNIPNLLQLVGRNRKQTLMSRVSKKQRTVEANEKMRELLSQYPI